MTAFNSLTPFLTCPMTITLFSPGTFTPFSSPVYTSSLMLEQLKQVSDATSYVELAGKVIEVLYTFYATVVGYWLAAR